MRMSIHVALIDQSEIVQKMLSHCLYHFSAEVLRFDNLKDSQSHFADKKPDIVFVDWEMKKDDEAVIYSAIQDMKPTPVVLTYRLNYKPQVDAIPEDQVPYRVRKPLEPQAVRDILTELVPQVKESKIHPFLVFPKSEREKKQVSAVPVQKGMDKHLVTSEADSPRDKPLQKKSPPGFKILDEMKEKTQTFLKHTLPGIVTEKIKPQEKPVSSKSDKSSLENAQNPLIQKLEKDKSQKVDSSLIEKEKMDPSISLAQQENKPTQTKMDKENINIDEDTQNDLAPMAIKSSASERGGFEADQNFALSDKDILKVLNKYKDTLEFQKLMENVLSEYAKETVANILEGNKVTDLLQQPLAEFKQSKKFQELVERQIIQYVKRQLPLLIKEIVEQEIKKIIGD